MSNEEMHDLSDPVFAAAVVRAQTAAIADAAEFADPKSVLQRERSETAYAGMSDLEAVPPGAGRIRGGADRS